MDFVIDGNVIVIWQYIKESLMDECSRPSLGERRVRTSSGVVDFRTNSPSVIFRGAESRTGGRRVEEIWLDLFRQSFSVLLPSIN